MILDRTNSTVRCSVSFWLVALVGLALFVVVDRALINAGPTPLLGIILLAVLSIWLPPKSLACLSAIYAVGVAYTLELSWRTPVAQFMESPNRWFRLGSFAVGCTTLVLLAQSRQKIARTSQSMHTLLAKLPVAILVSDQSGRIRLANDKAVHRFEMPSELLVGNSYFTLLNDPVARGKQVQRYFDRFNSKESTGREEAVRIQLQDGRVYQGVTVVIVDQGQKRLITALED